jgi:outer membrane autotransporter protein
VPDDVSHTFGVGSTVIGGAGAEGGASSVNLFGGNGGGGGDGVLAAGNSAYFENAGAVVGGTGGAGGSVNATVNQAGGGGSGGDGMRLVGQAIAVSNVGTVTGGVGGAAGTGTVGGTPAIDGAAGVGIRGLGNGLLIVNSGAIRGGNGTGAGAAGDAIVVNGASIIENKGEISGGTSAAGRAAAVLFKGLDNWLVLGDGSVVYGVLEVSSGSSATVRTAVNSRLNGAQLDGGLLTLQPETDASIDMGGPVSGTGQLASNGAGGLVLSGVNIDGTLDFLHRGGTVMSGVTHTSGSQHYTPSLTLGADTTIQSDSGSIALDGSIDGAYTLQLQNSGDISIGQAIGATTPLASLVVNAQSGTLSLPLTGTFAQGPIRLSGSQIVAGPISGSELELTPTSGMTISSNISSGSSLMLQSSGSITQTGGVVSAATLAGKLGGDLTLDSASNSIHALGDVSAGNISLTNSVPLAVQGVVNAQSLKIDDTRGVTITGSVKANSATINAGTIWTVGDGVTSGTLAADADVNGLLVYNRADDVSVNNKLAGNGQLLQRGGGRLIFEGDGSGFHGHTVVKSGEFVVGNANSNAILGGTVNVYNRASLGGIGRIAGDAVIRSGAMLSPLQSVGTLSVDGNFSMLLGTTMEAELGASGVGDKVAVAGDLDLWDVTLNVTDAGGMVPGVYNIFSYEGRLIPNATGGRGIVFGSVPEGRTLQLQTLMGDKRINVIDVTNTSLHYWNPNGKASPTQMGGGDGAWSLTSAVWTDATGSFNGAMTSPPGFAVFGGTAGVVLVHPGPVQASGMQFMSDGYVVVGGRISLINSGGPVVIRVGDGSSTSTGYIATIDSVLASNQGLNKTDAGTLVLNGANTYSGGVAIHGGSISVQADANLGDSGNDVALQGGNLRITGTSYSGTSRGLRLGPGGAVDIADAANTFTWSGAVTGAGVLIKRGAGTLVLDGANTYSGGNIVEAGTLQGDTDTLRGSIANNGALVFDQRSDGTFAGAIVGTGALTKQGNAALTLTGTNTYLGGTTVNAGSLVGTSRSLQGAINNNGTLIFNQSFDGVYGGAMSGPGALLKQGTGTLAVTGDSSSYSGAIQLMAGGLEVNGHLGGSLLATSGTTLGGTGIVGTTVIASGATLSPGSATAPFGTLQVNGDLTFAPGSSYQVDTTADGAADSVHVRGAANLAGAVVNVAANGMYSASTSYTILTADGGLNGNFDSASSNLAFLAPSLSTNGNSVELTMQLKQNEGSSLRFADAAQTRNQRATANALQSLSPGDPLYTRVLNLPEGAPPAVFDSLSGEVHASTTAILQAVAANVATLPMAHLRTNLNAGQLPGAPTAQLGAGNGLGLPRSSVQPVWAEVFGSWRSVEGAANTAKMKDTDSGLFVGGDLWIGGGWRLGGALGYANSDITVRDRGSSSDVSSYSAVIYGGKAFEIGSGQINLSLGAAYTWHDIDSKRNANAAGENQTLNADYRASTGQIFSEVGYALPLTDRVLLEPFVAGSFSDLRTRGFSESGGDAALSGMSDSNKVATTTLGLHVRSTFESAESQGSVYGTIGWRHAYGDVTPEATMAFQGSQSFSIVGAPIARDAAVLRLGASMAVAKRTTVGVSYGGQFGNGSSQNSGTLDVRHRF